MLLFFSFLLDESVKHGRLGILWLPITGWSNVFLYQWLLYCPLRWKITFSRVICSSFTVVLFTVNHASIGKIVLSKSRCSSFNLIAGLYDLHDWASVYDILHRNSISGYNTDRNWRLTSIIVFLGGLPFENIGLDYPLNHRPTSIKFNQSFKSNWQLNWRGFGVLGFWG